MRIAIIGKFKLLHDEEYIARSFEMLGHEVKRVHESFVTRDILDSIDQFNPDLVLWTKLQIAEPKKVREYLRKYKTACWVFDLYWGYQREYRLTSHPAFTADWVFTTDGGHDEDFKRVGINHRCVRQGIFRDECLLLPREPLEHEVAFVGSENQLHPTRAKQLESMNSNFKFKWIGRFDTNAARGLKLNELYARSGVVIGDSVYSPHYWSNRVVETLGRGGFLIHQEVPGLKEEYPHLITYNGDLDDLKERVQYYLDNEDERVDLILENYEWVRKNYTMEKKCLELLNYIS